LLKHIGLAAVVAAREISGCGFPAQVAVNALVIAVKLSGHVFRVFIRNVGHRFAFVSCRRKFDQSAFRDTGLFATCGLTLRRKTNRQACFISPFAERPIVRRFDTRGKARAGFRAPPPPLSSMWLFGGSTLLTDAQGKKTRMGITKVIAAVKNTAHRF
jgi:hypothetical protein